MGSALLHRQLEGIVAAHDGRQRGLELQDPRRHFAHMRDTGALIRSNRESGLPKSCEKRGLLPVSAGKVQKAGSELLDVLVSCREVAQFD